MKRDTPLLVALSMTGLTALALEVLWSRAMIPWVGGTALSQITTVAIYMAGLFIGSALAVPWLKRVAEPRALFFRIELVAALLSLAAVVGLPLADPLFALFSKGELLGSGLGSILRGLAGAGLMIPATILMGLSFPLAIAAFDRSQAGRGNAALAYGVNTLGATLGTLIGGFVLVPWLGVQNGAITIVVADLVVLIAALRTTAPAAASSDAGGAADSTTPALAKAIAVPAPAAPSEWPMLLSIFIGGMVSLGLQAILFRVLGLLLGPTARAFTVVLAVYVGGLGLGSLLVRRLVERGPRVAELVYLVCWLVAGGYGVLVYSQVGTLTHLVASGRDSGGFDLAEQLALRALIATLVLLPITAAFGASYSAAVAAAPKSDARRASRLYAALTLGNIIGLGVVAWGVLPSFRLDRALLLILAGALVTPLPALTAMSGRVAFRTTVAIVLAVAAAVVFFAMPGWPMRLMHTAAYVPGYAMQGLGQPNEVVRFHRSAFETSVTVIQVGEDLYLQLDGKTTGSTDVGDQATQGLLGALPAALHRNPKTAFVIGLGTGHTPAEVLRYPLDHVDCAEISPEVVDTMPLFAVINRRCDRDPRFRMLEADGRTVLRYGGTHYDLVISEPSNVWIPGVAHLFTKESFEDVRRCLEPEHGLCVQWMQGYAIDLATMKTIVRTFLSVFPHASLWVSGLEIPDLYLIGSQRPLDLDFADLDRRLTASKAPNPCDRDRPMTAVSLLRHFVAGPDTLRRFVGEGPFTVDARPMLEYAAEEALIGGAADSVRRAMADLFETPDAILADGGRGLDPAVRVTLERRRDANREMSRRLVEATQNGQIMSVDQLRETAALVNRFPDDSELTTSVVGMLAYALTQAQVDAGHELPELLELMLTVCKLDPTHPESLKFQALMTARGGQVPEGLRLMDGYAAAAQPWRVEPLLDKARLLAVLDRPAPALELMQQVAAKSPWFLSVWRELEPIARRLGKAEVATAAELRREQLGDEGKSAESQARLAAEMEAIDDS